ncbi:hypothetical protein [Umezawaea sp. NPDC059074]|uniref:hypothetical protein n=1 Tax=Umezawaea sp. NPDC059074 TaxID=3346716 RepID=UPI0036B4808D
MESTTGWFADVDPDVSDDHTWQPCLLLDDVRLSLDLWFATEEECLAFIRKEVVGRGVLGEVALPATGVNSIAGTVTGSVVQVSGVVTGGLTF